MAKTVYSVMMMKDKDIPGTVVRTSTIPEELGRVEFLFSDKTGTLTRNGTIVPLIAASVLADLMEIAHSIFHG